jgi:hypothetical protein
MCYDYLVLIGPLNGKNISRQPILSPIDGERKKDQNEPFGKQIVQFDTQFLRNKLEILVIFQGRNIFFNLIYIHIIYIYIRVYVYIHIYVYIHTYIYVYYMYVRMFYVRVGVHTTCVC